MSGSSDGSQDSSRPFSGSNSSGCDPGCSFSGTSSSVIEESSDHSTTTSSSRLKTHSKGQMDRQAGRQTDRQTDRQIINMCRVCVCVFQLNLKLYMLERLKRRLWSCLRWLPQTGQSACKLSYTKPHKHITGTHTDLTLIRRILCKCYSSEFVPLSCGWL